MYKHPSQPSTKLIRTVEKVALSSFVVCSFAAYALHERLNSTNAAGLDPSASQSPVASPQVAPAASGFALAPTDIPAQPVTSNNRPAQPAPRSTAVPTPVPAQARGQYKDGQYTGPSVNAFYGQVQVRAVIQNGKLADVQLLQYPSDRRTSVRINTFAVPVLQQEAVQAQNANVDFVSGATLTSEAFARSLQAALNSARS
ncbi:MAG: FMN-binding protein [Anaerolineae bacterium]